MINIKSLNQILSDFFEIELLPTTNYFYSFENQSHAHVFDVKFMFSKKATKNDEIFTVNLTFTTYCQINREDFVSFRGLFRKHEL